MHTTDVNDKVRRNGVVAGSGKRATEGKGVKIIKISYIERDKMLS